MAEVDPEDDTIWRWVIQHFWFDDAWRERRNVVVAAYDDESEFRIEFERHTQVIRAEIAAGARSSRESFTGFPIVRPIRGRFSPVKGSSAGISK